MKKTLSPLLSAVRKNGFTLIELLIVVAIIALLTAILIPDLTSSRAKARDAKRISDLGQIQLALSLYFDRCKEYPPALDITQSCSTSSGQVVTLGTYISEIPTPDPGGASTQTTYDYVVPSDNSDFMLHVTLESPNAVLKDGFQGPLPSGMTASWSCPTYTATDVDYCLGSK